jgi:hypothetical protein
VILEQAWGNLTAAYGTFVSTGAQDEGLFPVAPPDSPAAVFDTADQTVLQLSHGLVLLRVTLGTDGAIEHVELRPQVYVAHYIGF